MTLRSTSGSTTEGARQMLVCESAAPLIAIWEAAPEAMTEALEAGSDRLISLL